MKTYYLRKQNPKKSPVIYERNYKSILEREVLPVWSCELPHGEGWRALGLFSKIDNTARAAKDQTIAEYTSTTAHELAHKENHYRNINDPEIMTDMQMIASGAPPFIRPPEFYFSQAA